MSDVFLDEYSADAAVQKYRTATAGHGINYLLDHDYGTIYRQVLGKELPDSYKQAGIRLLEFGCGAGMNLIHVASLVERMGIRLNGAYGTDFSEKLIQVARGDAASLLKPDARKRVEFVVARNEAIINDMAVGLNVAKSSLLDSFHLIFGVNTFRYSYRMNKEDETARQLFDLLAKGAVCVMIDMNAQFRFFRSQLGAKQNVQDKQFYIPVLEDYVRPFVAAGFQIVAARNFCWMPHSAGPTLSRICRILTPALNVVAPRYALRSLVIAKKPA